MNVLKIGYYDYLVPDGVDAGRLLAMLSKLEPCNEQLYRGVIELPGSEDHPMMKPMELGLKPVPAKTKFVVKDGEVEQAVEVASKTAKRPQATPKRPALRAPSQETFLLGGPRR